MTVYFDGKKFAVEKEEELKIKVAELKKRGITPKLTSIIVGDDQGSVLYQNLKKKAAERVGAILEIKKLRNEVSKNEIIEVICGINADKKVNGIMVQLPLPKSFSKQDKEIIINAIDKNKDVDGLRIDSPFLHPTSKAVLEVLDYALDIVRLPCKVPPYKVCVVGATGMVGGPLTKELRIMNNELRDKSIHNRRPGECKRPRNLQFEILEADSKTQNLSEFTRSADVLISCAGVSEIIKKDMVKDGVILIDVGAPVGDVEKNAYEKASFVSPVPGGIGPVTICCLMENLISVFV